MYIFIIIFPHSNGCFGVFSTCGQIHGYHINLVVDVSHEIPFISAFYSSLSNFSGCFNPIGFLQPWIRSARNFPKSEARTQLERLQARKGGGKVGELCDFGKMGCQPARV